MHHAGDESATNLIILEIFAHEMRGFARQFACRIDRLKKKIQRYNLLHGKMWVELRNDNNFHR